MVYEIIIEDIESGNINKIDVKTRTKAMKIYNQYQFDYRVMINRLDEEYGICENIIDNKDVIDFLKDIQDKNEEVFND